MPVAILTHAPPPVGAWKDGICDCCKHPRSACHGYWCWPCMLGQMQEKMVGPKGVCFQTCCCAVALQYCAVVDGGLSQWVFAAMQAKNVLTRTRELYAIPGDQCNDCLCACFCLTCSMCRVYRHVNDYHGVDADKTVCCDCSATLDNPHPPTHAWAGAAAGRRSRAAGHVRRAAADSASGANRLRARPREARGDGHGRPGRGRPCLLYTSPSPRDGLLSRMPSSA